MTRRASSWSQSWPFMNSSCWERTRDAASTADLHGSNERFIIVTNSWPRERTPMHRTLAVILTDDDVDSDPPSLHVVLDPFDASS